MAKRPRQHVVTQAIAFVLLLAGFAVALYPFYSGALNTMLDRARVARVDRENSANAKKLQAQMAKTNAKLQKSGLHADADPFSGLTDKQKINLKKDQIGSVTIPKIKLTVPLFKTLAEETLQVGAAVVFGTSMPTGGVNTHTVIAGHRGLVDRRLFSDLNRVKRGNIFVLKVADQHLAYKVFRIQTVLPDNTSILKIEPGKDLATLLTCTPYMINSHRLLVTGQRVPYTKAIAKAVARSEAREKWQQALILIGCGLALLLLFGLIGCHIHALLLKRHVFDLWFTVVDANGDPVTGVTFDLRKPHGKALYRHGKRLTVTTDEQGHAQISHLAGAMYRLQHEHFHVACGVKQLKQQKMRFYPTKAQADQIKSTDAGWTIRW